MGNGHEGASATRGRPGGSALLPASVAGALATGALAWAVGQPRCCRRDLGRCARRGRRAADSSRGPAHPAGPGGRRRHRPARDRRRTGAPGDACRRRDRADAVGRRLPRRTRLRAGTPRARGPRGPSSGGGAPRDSPMARSRTSRRTQSRPGDVIVVKHGELLPVDALVLDRDGHARRVGPDRREPSLEPPTRERGAKRRERGRRRDPRLRHPAGERLDVRGHRSAGRVGRGGPCADDAQSQIAPPRSSCPSRSRPPRRAGS